MRIWLLLALLGLLGVTWWASRPEPVSTQLQTADREQIQDYFVQELGLRQFDKQGELAHLLHAQKLKHFLESGITQLQQPRYVLYTDKEPNWRISADKGSLSQDQSLLQLQGNTVIDWLGNETRPPMQMLTLDLTIYPKTEYAETAAPVTVTSEQNWIKSLGMQAWLKSPGRIRFLAQTRAHYVAQ